jgi:hypothetical protein
MSNASVHSRRSLFIVAAALAATLGCQDKNLGDARTSDANTTFAPTCASIGGTCGAASNCAVGAGHLAAATSDCERTGTTPATCCLPQSACPTETFMCCTTTPSTTAAARPVCEIATAGSLAKLVCAAGLTAC